jgi:hypothetical protein
VYPGRHCYYFRYLPGTAVPELKRCDEARELLSRSTVELDSERAPFWVRPTAYYRTDYDPAHEVAALLRRTKDGQPRLACCRLRAAERVGEPVPAAQFSRCIDTGDGPR